MLYLITTEFSTCHQYVLHRACLADFSHYSLCLARIHIKYQIICVCILTILNYSLTEKLEKTHTTHEQWAGLLLPSAAVKNDYSGFFPDYVQGAANHRVVTGFNRWADGQNSHQ